VWLGFCLRSACFMLASVLHSFIEYYMCTSDSTESLSWFTRCNRRSMRVPAGLHSFFRAFLISGAYFAHTIVRKLFESARFGSQAFNGATAFNADIGAWNTASMTTMANVSPSWPLFAKCVLHARLCVSLIPRVLYAH
jgi:hypothetical protein